MHSNGCFLSSRTRGNAKNKSKRSGRTEKSEKERKLVQMFLDVGQKNFYSTTCSECGFVYTPGKNEEERLHQSHHKDTLSLNLMKLNKLPEGSTLLMDDGTLGQIYKMYYFKKRNSSGNGKSIMVCVMGNLVTVVLVHSMLCQPCADINMRTFAKGNGNM